MGSFGGWLAKKIFRPAQRFLGKTLPRGISAAARWIGKKALPVLRVGTGIIRDVAANPLAQAAASAVLGPEAALAMNGISAAAAFGNSATRAAPSILHGFKSPQTAGQSVQDLANLQQQYKNLNIRH